MLDGKIPKIFGIVMTTSTIGHSDPITMLFESKHDILIPHGNVPARVLLYKQRQKINFSLIDQ